MSLSKQNNILIFFANESDFKIPIKIIKKEIYDAAIQTCSSFSQFQSLKEKRFSLILLGAFSEKEDSLKIVEDIKNIQSENCDAPILFFAPPHQELEDELKIYENFYYIYSPYSPGSMSLAIHAVLTQTSMLSLMRSFFHKLNNQYSIIEGLIFRLQKEQDKACVTTLLSKLKTKTSDIQTTYKNIYASLRENVLGSLENIESEDAEAEHCLTKKTRSS